MQIESLKTPSLVYYFFLLLILLLLLSFFSLDMIQFYRVPIVTVRYGNRTFSQ